MRLTPHEVAAIKAAARLTYGERAVVRLFGSRVDDARRGGDIDLHLEVDGPIDRRNAAEHFRERLFARLDEQRVDVITTVRGEEPQPIERIAYRDGIIL